MTIYEDLFPTDFSNISTYELRSRPSRVTTDSFAKPLETGTQLDSFLDAHPKILAASGIKELADRLARARHLKKPIVWGIGGHVVKTGLAPILIDLMDHGFCSALAANGSVLVHDSEIARVGFTSEDVDASLGEGDFGAARETGQMINNAASRAQDDGIGLGEAVGRELDELSPEFAEYSLLHAAYKRRLPVTVHLTIGADIGHFHPGVSGAALGESSHFDFRLLCSLVRKIAGGGVYLNVGSAVTMPELFLKAVTVNNNLGHAISDITTANFDFIQHYRPLTNVVRRPIAGGKGKGFSITGHHELTIPLLAAHLKRALQ